MAYFPLHEIQEGEKKKRSFPYHHICKNPHDCISFEATRYFTNFFYGGQIPILYIKKQISFLILWVTHTGGPLLFPFT